jgi:hypothetical protein
MSPLLEQIVKTHRVENEKREALLMRELEQRRQEIARCACIDIQALREKLAI